MLNINLINPKQAGSITILILLIISIVYIGGRYIYYGSLFRSCIYTEKELHLPVEISAATFTIARNSYQATGADPKLTCLPELSKINLEIVAPKTIANNTVGENYYTTRGLTVELLPANTTLRLVKAISVIKHGISRIDSGPGPIDYLILEDESGSLYKIATVSLGVNEGEPFLDFRDPKDTDHATKKLLTVFSFKTSPPDYDSLSLTGEFDEVNKASLTPTRPAWKKLTDRIEQGEKITVTIKLENRVENDRLITLADNETERKQQVSTIQNLLIAKIPPKLLKDVSMEKDQNHPSITFTTISAELLNFLGERELLLNIEYFSESV